MSIQTSYESDAHVQETVLRAVVGGAGRLTMIAVIGPFTRGVVRTVGAGEK
jgi:uncharacterized protein YqfA (UPF0365 family)